MKYILIFAMIVVCCGLTSCSREVGLISLLSKTISAIEIHTFTTFIKTSLLFAAISIALQIILFTFGVPFIALISWIIIAILIIMNDKMGFGMKVGLISSVIVSSSIMSFLISLIWGGFVRILLSTIKLLGKIKKD